MMVIDDGDDAIRPASVVLSCFLVTTELAGFFPPPFLLSFSYVFLSSSSFFLFRFHLKVRAPAWSKNRRRLLLYGGAAFNTGDTYLTLEKYEKVISKPSREDTNTTFFSDGADLSCECY